MDGSWLRSTEKASPWASPLGRDLPAQQHASLATAERRFRVFTAPQHASDMAADMAAERPRGSTEAVAPAPSAADLLFAVLDRCVPSRAAEPD